MSPLRNCGPPSTTTVSTPVFRLNSRSCIARSTTPCRRSCALARRTKLALVLCFAARAFAREEYTRVFDQTFPLAQGQTVRVEHKLGDVVVRTHAKPEVIVHANIRVMLAWGAGGAKKFAENIVIDVHPF